MLLPIGGWTWSTFFSNAALTSASRRAFVASCIDLFIKGNLPQLGSIEGGPGSAAVQGYDFHGTWESTTNHQSAIFQPAGQPILPDFTVERAIGGIARGSQGPSWCSACPSTAAAGPA